MIKSITGMEDECPECGGTWIGEPIPEHQQDLFGGAKFYRKVMGLYDHNKDMVTQYLCPHCDTLFNREF